MRTLEKLRPQDKPTQRTVADAPRGARAGKERILIEFPSGLLERADEAAAALDQNRSAFIRTAVEQLLEGMQRKKLEALLAEAYSANATTSLEIAEDFLHVDREGFR